MRGWCLVFIVLQSRITESCKTQLYNRDFYKFQPGPRISDLLSLVRAWFLGRNLDSSEDAGDYLLGFSPKRFFSIKNPGGVLVVSDQEKVKNVHISE